MVPVSNGFANVGERNQRPLRVDGDVGAVFGIGFPPFFGGPFRYMDSLGIAKTVETLNNLAVKYGDKFEPCELLCNMAENNQTFFSANA